MKLVKTQLNLEETVQFVRNVVNTVFTTDEQGNPTDYTPELYDAALHLETAKAYFGFTESNDFNADYDRFMTLDLDTLSNSELDITQFYAMESAIQERIAFCREILIRKASKDSLSLLLDTLTEKLDTFDISSLTGDNVMGLLNKLQGNM